jgi:hypothetical protein
MTALFKNAIQQNKGQLTKRFLDFLAHCIGHGRNWASLIRWQLSGGHDDALDVRARLVIKKREILCLSPIWKEQQIQNEDDCRATRVVLTGVRTIAR